MNRERTPGRFSVAVTCLLFTGYGLPISGEETNSLGVRMIPIEPGEYIRGAIKGDDLRKNHPLSTGGVGGHDARPRHRVKLTKPFLIAATEVTVGQFRAFVEATGYETSAETDEKGALAFLPEVSEEGVEQFGTRTDCTWENPGWKQADDHPVVCVSWKDAVAFCEWLSEKEGNPYRLPTEAEWEYAARAGTTTSYLGGNDAGSIYAFGNVADAALEKAHPGMTLRQRIADLEEGKGDGFVYTAPVGSRRPNAWGLFDTHGNAWEWCSDKYHDLHYRELTGGHINHDEPETLPLITDPQGPDDSPNHRYGDWRVMRGGAWCTGPLSSRSAVKTFGEAGDAFCYTGFRVAMDVESESAQLDIRSAVEAAGGTIEFAADNPNAPIAIDLYNGNNPLKKRGGKNEAIDDAWLAKHLAGLASLRRLSLSNCAVTNEGMRVVGELTGLEELNLTLTAVSDEGLAHLGNLTKLRVLGLASSQCDGTGFVHLRKLTKLESVNFHFTPVNDAGLKAIAAVPNSGRFWFAHTRFTDAGAKALSGMKDLKTCGIGSSNPESSGAAVAYLARLPLEDLSLLDHQADPVGIAHAVKITTLTRLDIAHAPMADDTSLALIAEHPKLKELRIGGSPAITDAGIRSLKNAKALEKLTLQRLKNVTEAGIEALREARPDLEIEVK